MNSIKHKVTNYRNLHNFFSKLGNLAANYFNRSLLVALNKTWHCTKALVYEATMGIIKYELLGNDGKMKQSLYHSNLSDTVNDKTREKSCGLLDFIQM